MKKSAGKKRLKQEYRKHLRYNGGSFLSYSLGFLAVSLLLFIGVAHWLAPLRKAQRLEQIETYISIREWTFIIAWCLFAILIFVFAHQRILAETVKYYHGGYSIKDVYLINALDHLLIMGIPLMILAVYLLYEALIRLLSIWMVIIPLTILTALLLFWTGGKIFGKSTGV